MEIARAASEVVQTRCHYQDAESTQTLREGLAEYRAANPNLFDPDALAGRPELGDLWRFFAAHDACHVLFGLNTSLPDEALADTWTIFGTDVKWKELKSYFASDAQQTFFRDFIVEVGVAKLLWSSFATLPRVMRAMWRARKMTRKWSLHHWPAHLDVPLCELRAEYGIRLV